MANERMGRLEADDADVICHYPSASQSHFSAPRRPRDVTDGELLDSAAVIGAGISNCCQPTGIDSCCTHAPLSIRHLSAASETGKALCADSGAGHYSGPAVRRANAGVCRTESVPIEESLNQLCLTESLTPDFYNQDEDGDTLLHLVLLVDPPLCPSWITYVISCARDVSQLDIANKRLQTPLHLAVITDRPDIVQVLVNCGANVSRREGLHGDTALHLACRLNRKSCFSSLVAGIARRKSDDGLLRLLLEATNYEGETCLHIVARLQDKGIFHQLIEEHLCDINVKEGKRGETVLHQAVDHSDHEVIRTLIAQSLLRINQQTYDGCTAYDYAFSRNLENVKTSLAAAGAQPSLRSQMSDSSEDEDDVMDVQ